MRKKTIKIDDSSLYVHKDKKFRRDGSEHAGPLRVAWLAEPYMLIIEFLIATAQLALNHGS